MQKIPLSTLERVIMYLFLFLVNVLTHFHQTNLYSSTKAAGAEYHWTFRDRETVMFMYYFGYVTTPIFGGLWSDFYGGKNLLLTSSVLSAIGCFLTPYAENLYTASVLQFFMGLVEGVRLPAIHQISAIWFPIKFRTIWICLIISGYEIGAVLSFLFVPTIFNTMVWKMVFYLSGAITLVYCVAYFLFFPNIGTERMPPDPQCKISSQATEIRNEGELWLSILLHPAIFSVVFAHLTFTFAWSVYSQWFPSLLLKYSIDPVEIPILTKIPYALMAGCTIIAGAYCNLLFLCIDSPSLSRKLMTTVAFVGCSLGLCLSHLSNSISWLSVVFAFVSFASLGFARAGYWISLIDISYRYVGRVTGYSCTVAGVMKLLSHGIITQLLVVSAGHWTVVMSSLVSLLFLSAFLYLLLSKSRIIMYS